MQCAAVNTSNIVSMLPRYLLSLPLQDISEEDQKILEQFLPKETEKRRTLQDAILEKIKERRTEVISGIWCVCGLLFK